MHSLRQDVRFAVRSLRHAGGTTLIAVLCLALGIGANTAIFSVVRAVLLESLPYRSADRLVTIDEVGRQGPGNVSGAMYRDLAALHHVFSDVTAWTRSNRDLGDVANPERLSGIRATTNLFTTLGATPLLGRGFTPDDDPASGARVVVLSEGLWRRQFAADPSLLGREITLSGTKYTVVGIMPAAFDFPMGPVHRQFWVPLNFRNFGDLTNRANRSFRVVARLAPGVDSASAKSSLDVLAHQLETSYPVTNKDRGLLATSVTTSVVGKVRPALLVLLGAVGLVLLIACANVANLTLARAAGRRREVAIRMALGAARGRLVRQLLTESAIVSLAGGALGLGVAWWGLHALLGVSAAVLPRSESIGIQGSVLLFATIVSLATAIGVGLVPAIRASRPDLRADLADAAGRSSTSGASHRTLETLIAAEIALSVVLLAGAGLVIRSFVALMNVDSGFRTENVLTFGVSAPARAIADTARYTQFYAPILERIRALPNVRAAGMIDVLPIAGGRTDRFFNIVGRPRETQNSKIPDAELRAVSPDYFRAFGIALLSGRDFTENDNGRSPPVIIVNDELVRRFFPGENPLGHQIDFDGPRTIVGVARAVREVGLDQHLLPEFYVPAAQSAYGTQSMSFVVSTTGDPAPLTSAVREVVHAVAAQQPIYGMATMTDIMRASLGSRRLLLMLLGLFAGLALALSAAGVYGVMSYGVTQRRREIGIRIALGAGFGEVARMILRDVARVAGIGILAGLIVALALSRVMTSVLYSVSASGAVTFAAVPVVIGIVAMVAGAVPAVRAARVDPLIAMRVE